MDNTNNNQLASCIALLSDFDNVALVDFAKGRALTNSKENIFSKHVPGFYNDIIYSVQLTAFSETLVHELDRDYVLSAMSRDKVISSVAASNVYYVNYRVVINGDLKYYQTKFSRSSTKAGEMLIAVGTHDVTYSIQEYVRDLNDARKQAEAVNEAKSKFLTNLSHDIRTPLNGVMGMVELAKRNISDVDKVSKYLENMSNESNHLQSLLNDVLDVSSLEDNHVSIIKRPLNIKRFIENCVSIVSNELVEKDVNITTDLQGFDHIHLLGDELHLEKAIVNILDNAIKFTRDGDIIYFRAYENLLNDKQVSIRFEIEDTGIGMRSDFVEHVFDPFSQEFKDLSDSSRGSGLGLTITKMLVELMDGKISVRSTQGIGSKFIVTLVFDIDKDTEKSLSKKSSNLSDSVAGIRVMIVEDNNINRSITESILRAENAETYSVANGRQAVDLFESTEPGSFDVILMDIMMPEMNGLQAAIRIREMDRPDAKNIPIIAMTANAFEEDIRKSEEAGMNAHLSKPVKASVLIETILKFI